MSATLDRVLDAERLADCAAWDERDRAFERALAAGELQHAEPHIVLASPLTTAAQRDAMVERVLRQSEDDVRLPEGWRLLVATAAIVALALSFYFRWGFAPAPL